MVQKSEFKQTQRILDELDGCLFQTAESNGLVK